MKHKKDNHGKEVQVCWKFGIGQCPFGDNKCWFIHEEKTESTEYTCKLCGKAFLNLQITYKLSKFVKMECVFMERIVGSSMKDQKE